MTALAERLKEKYFSQEHPYRILEREVERYVRPEHTLLDAGCGRTAPVLTKFKGRVRRLIGVDIVDFPSRATGMELLKHDLSRLPLESECVDVVVSRSVMEHVTDPAPVYAELFRVLKPGGPFIFLTANLWDYASIIAKLVPNRFHPWIVSKTEGRREEDVFPIAYRTNTRRAVSKWARQTGFDVVSFRYLGQYPSYFMFNGFLFLLATGYEKLISKVTALSFLEGWIFVILKKPMPDASDSR
jgi:SAM-dependent methyltransferase